MAHLYRLVALCALACWSFASFALIPPVSGYRAVHQSKPVATAYFLTKQQACDAAPAAYSAAYGGTAFVSSFEDTACFVQSSLTGGEIFTFEGGSSACPANSSTAPGGCQCNAGYVENSAQTACELPPDPCVDVKGAIYGEIEWASTTKGNHYGCVGGEGMIASCQTVAVCDYTQRTPGQAGYTCRGNAYATGARSVMCTGTGESSDSPSKPPVTDPVNPDKPPVPGQPAPARCPAGQAPGEFNGARICAPTGSGSETSTPAPGNGSSTVNNSDGSSTTSTQTGRTTCVQGQCTTVTNNTNVTTNAPGNDTCPSGQTPGTKTVNGQTRTTCTGTKEGTTTEAQTGFCEKNPKDKQCDGDGADNSFGGACAGGFKAVSDDAVLNAMAEEQYRRNCEFFEKKPDATDETRAYDAMVAKGKQGGDQTGDLPEGSKRDYTIGPGDFDYTSAIGPQQCFTDRSVTMWGKSIAIPLSVVCPWLEILGNILVVVGSLLAARIVVRG